MFRRENFFLLAVIISGIIVPLLLGILDGKIFLTRVSDWGNDAQEYNATALSLVHNHSLHDARSAFFGPFQKGPGYPIFLAAVYELFGEHPLFVWILQLALWLASLFLLLFISEHFLSGLWKYAPPFLLALYWGAAVYVVDINSDLLALFLSVLFVWSYLQYQKNGRTFHPYVQGVVLGFLILTKPIALYFIALYFFLALILVKFSKRHLFALVGGVLIAGAFAASWSVYNHRLLGTYQLASGALTLMRRADDVEMNAGRVGAFITASAFGDYIANRFFPGYAADPEPYTAEATRREKKYYASQAPDKSNEAFLQQQYYQQAYGLIKNHPIKFVLTGSIYLLRLNSPVNLKGVEMIHTFVGTKDHVPRWFKFLFLITLHGLWFLFLGVVFFELFRLSQTDFKHWGMIFFLIFYFNGMYTLVSHAEARYILPVLPFYFLLLVLFVQEYGYRFSMRRP